MRKIAYICGLFNTRNCGISHFIENLSVQLDSFAFESKILTSYDCLKTNVNGNVIGITYDWTLNSIIRLAIQLIKSDFDLIHLHYSEINYQLDRSIFILPFIMKFLKSKKPVVLTIHEWPDIFRENTFVLKANDAIVVTCKNMENTILYPKSRIYSIPIASSIKVGKTTKEDARLEVFRRLKWDPKATIITYFGFLNPIKNLEMLIDVFEEVARKRDVRLLIMGGVESLSLPQEKGVRYQKLLIKRIKSKKLEKKIAITGFLPSEEVSLFLKASDLGVLPSKLGVGIKNSAFQTMIAHGLPVIASYHPLAGDEILTYDFVRVFMPANSQMLKKEMTNLLNDREMMEENSRKGVVTAEKFNWENIAKSHADLYGSLLP